ncbi:hypothetical protein JOC77_000717 [Peribacillus deserti]|uniref:Uncharacterized protein n=1 Tax=Peribacillus deserti TaxID=673318 RepID=A0ABS2QDS4_9BACI|nr:hypothetical protein [Peribacillus deserti]MBM7691312.1 hypothetical protein [Peribacillus deserti]
MREYKNCQSSGMPLSRDEKKVVQKKTEKKAPSGAAIVLNMEIS